MPRELTMSMSLTSPDFVHNGAIPALDSPLPNLQKPGKAQLEAAMQGHVLAQAELVGTYQH